MKHFLFHCSCITLLLTYLRLSPKAYNTVLLLFWYNNQFFCIVIQDFASIFCNKYKVFNTNTDILIWKVDSRLY